MIQLYLGDCLDIMQDIQNNSVDMILCDLPYGVTANNKWDQIIPFEDMWSQYKRIIKKNGAIVLFGQDKFTAKLMLSNIKQHRYNIIWDKVHPSGFLNANKMPLRSHEDILVFYDKLPTYNPQKTAGSINHGKGNKVGQISKNNNYRDFEIVDNKDIHKNLKFPVSIVTFQKDHPSVCVHPTQKPIELMEYLIKTYTNKGETVMDNCMGSGTTGIAAKNLGRSFIGIEQDEEYYKIAEKRIRDAQ